MVRNPNSREKMLLNAATETKQNSDRHSYGVVRDTVYNPANTDMLLEPDTFARVINDWKQLADVARHQLEVLNDLNCALRKELAELAEKEARARHSAYHDGLTGLPNRSLLQDRFHQARSQAKRDHKPLALVLIDLDQFKQVNDELGHASGDKLLQEVAHRMTQAIRGSDTACRYGGDEFVIMLPVIDSPAIATALTAEIDRRLCEPYRIDDHLIQMTVSIGLAVYPGDGKTFDNLMKQADISMYRAKRTGDNGANTGVTPEVPAKAEWRKPSSTGKTDHLRKQGVLVQGDPVVTCQQTKKH